MARQQISLKQLAINKDNTAIVIAVGLAAFIVVFSLVASNALLKQRSYQAKVIGKKKTALRQLKTNVSEVEKLQNSYKAFAESQQNALGGNAAGTGDKDGENPRLILDALPSKYDFPALTTSLEKVFTQYQIESISGVDDELTQAEVQTSNTPQPVDMPFSITLKTNTQAAESALQLFEKSIRPIQVQKIELIGNPSELTLAVTAKTFFQPQKKFDVKKEVVTP